MKSQFNYALLCTTVLAAVCLNQAPASAQQQQAAAPVIANQDSIPDIIVTANRRDELNQSVPIAITAFSSERMRQMNVTKPQDLQATVPSLIVGSNGQGSRDSQTFTLRGQGATFQASPGVVVYMNEVPLPAPISLSQQGSAGNYLDLENLQVLAGPQGTLFGRNTTGGAILLVPRKPTDKLEGSVSAKFGNYDTAEFEGVLNIPVVKDKLLVRAVGGYTDRDGYTRDITFNKKLDDTHWYTGRLGVTFMPTDNFENYTMGYATHQSNNGTGLIHKGFNIAGLQGVGFCTDGVPTGIQVPCNDYRAYTAQADALGPRATAPSVDQGQRTNTWGVTNTTRFEINPDLAIRNIFSYQRFKSFYFYDGDGAFARQYDSSIRSNTLPRDHLTTITEELQAQGSALDKKLTYTVGGFFYDQKPAGPSGAQSNNYCPEFVRQNFGPAACPTNTLRSDVRNESKAVYFQASLDVGGFISSLEGLKLTGGYRHTWDTITGSAAIWSPVPTMPGTFTCSSDSSTVTGDPAVGCRFAATLKSDSPNWTVGLDYQARPDLLLFGKVSKGYKSGGFNAYAVFPTTRTFTPEYVTSYEAGFKSDIKLGNIPARLNSAFYYVNYSNIQKATGDFNPVTFASGARINPASAHIKGIELDATIRPVEWLELGGSFSYTDFNYTRYTIPANGLQDCSGTTPTFPAVSDISCLKGQYIAPYSYNLRGTITFPVPEEYGNMSLFMNYAHNSSQNTEALILPAFQPGAILEPFGLLNGSLDWNNVYQTGIDIGLYATNITNKLYRISNSDVYQSGSLLSWTTIYGEPRMFGARIRYHFGS